LGLAERVARGVALGGGVGWGVVGGLGVGRGLCEGTGVALAVGDGHGLAEATALGEAGPGEGVTVEAPVQLASRVDTTAIANHVR